MDWTGYTPLYARTTGDDTLGDGTLLNPYLTPQKVYQVAFDNGPGNYVLDIGSGVSGTVTPLGGAAWPSRIGVRGAGTGVSFVTVAFNGVAPGDDANGTNGLPVTIQSDLTVSLSISTSGSYGGNSTTSSGYNGGHGAAIALIDVYCPGTVSTRGGEGSNAVEGSGGSGGNGASISLTRCSIGAGVFADGGNGAGAGGGGTYEGGAGGNGAAITAVDCEIVGYPDSRGGGAGSGNGGNGRSGGNAGPITLTNSRAAAAFCHGGGSTSGGDQGGNGGSGANFTMTAGSSVGAVDTSGASGGGGSYNNGAGGSAGTIVATDSHFTGGNIHAFGGGGVSPQSGAGVTITNCTYTLASSYNINVNGGSASAGPSDSTYISGAAAGVVFITGFRRRATGGGLYTVTAAPGYPVGSGSFGSSGLVNITRATKAFYQITVPSGSVNFEGVCDLPTSTISAGVVGFSNHKQADTLGASGL